MKMAGLVEGFFIAQPVRDFRMIDILRSVSPANATAKERSAIRRQVHRVIEAFAESGFLLIRPPTKRRGGYATYRLKV